MKTLILFTSALICLTIGCAKMTYHGLKPIKPGVLSDVVELRPTFKWKSSEIPSDKYDFIIYESTGATGYAMAGKTVYYREALETSEHTLEQDLVLGEAYYWSVRCRNGERVDNWSRYDMFANTGMINITKKNHLFKIYVTTVEAQKEEEIRNR